uniref:Katanin_con80 domain-containing protein n=1 Tax=Rhabditophanes sp. KR3021 TaxID=114890 RepID=A0AC35TJE5_9BILA
MQAKCDAENKVILNELDTVISSIKNGGIKKVLSQRMVFSKGNSMGIVFKELLNIDALWSMHLVELAIPHLNNLLTSKNRETVDVGLEMLELIVNEYVPIIKENLSCPIEYSYRVDISAEERKERCMTCQQRLTQLMFNASFLKERMSKEQQGYFQEIVDKSGLI